MPGENIVRTQKNVGTRKNVDTPPLEILERIKEVEDPMARWALTLQWREGKWKNGDTPLPEIPEKIKEVENPLERLRLMRQWLEEN